MAQKINGREKTKLAGSLELLYEADVCMSMNLRRSQLRLLPPATKLWQGNIFSSVCQEFCSGGGVTWAGTLRQLHTPPWAGTLLQPAGTPPGQVHPPGQVYPPADTHPQHVHPPQAGNPLGGYPPWSMSGRYTSYWNAFLFEAMNLWEVSSTLFDEAGSLSKQDSQCNKVQMRLYKKAEWKTYHFRTNIEASPFS